MNLRQSDNKGYKRIILRIDGHKKNHFVHRLVAMTFLEKVEGKNFVNHINGIKTDNRLENLEWCTISENTKHAYDIGIFASPSRKFDDIHYLAYATCLKKYAAKNLNGIMSFSNFRHAVTGKSKLSVSNTLVEHLREMPSRKGKRAREALKKIKGGV
jgi:hypothetical protein